MRLSTVLSTSLSLSLILIEYRQGIMIRAAIIRFLRVLRSLFQKLVPVSPSCSMLPDIGDAHYVGEYAGGGHFSSRAIALDQHRVFVVALCCEEYDVVGAIQDIE